MGKPKHTPGPWVADVDYVHGPIVTAANGDIVSDYTMWDGHRDEASANARLIGAALEMLEALTDTRGGLLELVDLLTTEGWAETASAVVEQIRVIDAAIAKATGQ